MELAVVVRGTKPGFKLLSSTVLTALSRIKVGPFLIKRKVSDLTNELDRQKDFCRIHPIVSVAPLEQAVLDRLMRGVNAPPPLLTDG
jgi:hypothetical protein